MRPTIDAEDRFVISGAESTSSGCVDCKWFQPSISKVLPGKSNSKRSVMLLFAVLFST
jgi:hypothetical protein